MIQEAAFGTEAGTSPGGLASLLPSESCVADAKPHGSWTTVRATGPDSVMAHLLMGLLRTWRGCPFKHKALIIPTPQGCLKDQRK